MLIEIIWYYCFNRLFLYQSIASLTTYLAIRLAHLYHIRMKRIAFMKELGVPIPEVSWMYGNYHHYLSTTAYFEADEEYRKRYGKYYAFFIGDEPNLTVTDLSIIKKVFLEHPKHFEHRRDLYVDNPLTHGILFASPSRWKVMRETLSVPFKQYNSRNGVSTKYIEESIELLCNYIDQKKLEATSSGKPMEIDIYSLMKSTALYLMSSMSLKLPGIKVMENEPNVISLNAFSDQTVNGLVRYIVMFPFLRPIGEFFAERLEHGKILSVLNTKLEKRIEEGLNDFKNHKLPTKSEMDASIIDTLINAHIKGKLIKKEIIGNVLSVLAAGYDTTSTSLTYLFWVIGKNPDIQDRLRSELLTYGLESEYLVQVIKETMRLYPVVVMFTTRYCTKTLVADYLTIPQGTIVVYNSWLMNRDPELWKDPYKFDPSRFDSSANISPCAFAPFGFGERRCLGYQLAMAEMKMILADLLLKYRVTTLQPEVLTLRSHAFSLTQPKIKVLLSFDRL